MKLPWLATGVLLVACCGRKQAVERTTSATPANTVAAIAPALVYRTRTNLNDHVPVQLSEDRSSILAYPDPKDVRTDAGFPLPSELGGGYLLDNRGIGPNVAFLRMTYAEYAALDKAPPIAELEAAILDRDPLIELCDCGSRAGYADPVAQLGELVKNNTLTTRCKKLK